MIGNVALRPDRAGYIEVAASLIALLGPAEGAFAQTCARAQEGPTVMLQPPEWRAAVDALRDATTETTQPWGCAGGIIDLVAHEGGATLMIRDAEGNMVSREV